MKVPCCADTTAAVRNAAIARCTRRKIIVAVESWISKLAFWNEELDRNCLRDDESHENDSRGCSKERVAIELGLAPEPFYLLFMSSN